MNGFMPATHGVCADCADGGGANTHVPGGCGATPNAVAARDQLARCGGADGDPGELRPFREHAERPVEVVGVGRHERRRERREVVGKRRIGGGRDSGAW
jgi:hypothetical protein